VNKFYIQPQISFLEDFVGFGITSYWDNNETARFIAFNFDFINMVISLTFGIRKK